MCFRRVARRVCEANAQPLGRTPGCLYRFHISSGLPVQTAVVHHQAQLMLWCVYMLTDAVEVLLLLDQIKPIGPLVPVN